MKILDKKRILEIISEEIRTKDIREMAHKRTEDWSTEKLNEPREFDAIGDISSINPETNEVVQGKIYSSVIRVSPNGSKLVEFFNQSKGGMKMFYDYRNHKLFQYPPRNSVYGTAYTAPKMEKLKDIDPDKYDEKVEIENERWTKKYVLYPLINELFNKDKIKIRLFMAGLPILGAGKEFTEPVTNVDRRMRYIGPELSFELHSVRDETDVQNALDKIISYRERLANEEEPENTDMGDLAPKKHVRMYGGNVYPGGHWKEYQRTFSEKYHELTPKYHLHMKAVQGGEISYTLTTKLKVYGTAINEDSYILRLILTFSRSMRDITKSKGTSKGDVIPPIEIIVREPKPYNIVGNFTVRENKEFYENIFKKGLIELGRKILEIDPDETLPDFEPDDNNEFDDEMM